MTRLLSLMPGSHILVSLWTGELFGCPVSLLSSLALVKTVEGVVKAGFKDPNHPSRHEPPMQTLVVCELVKCIITIALLYQGRRTVLWRPFSEGTDYVYPSEEALPLYSESAEETNELDAHVQDWRTDRLRVPIQFGAKQLYVAVSPIACLLLLRHQLLLARRPYANQATLDIVDALVILFVGLYAYFFTGKPTPLRHWTSSMLQITAISIIHHIMKVPQYSAGTYSLLLVTSAISALSLVVISLVYQTLHDISFNKLNLALFSSSLAGYVAAMLLEPSQGYARSIATPLGMHHRDLIASAVVLALRIASDFLSLAILRRSSAFTLASITLLSSSLATPLWHAFFWTTIPFSNVQWLASGLAIYAALSYLLDGAPAASPRVNTPSPWPLRRSLVFLALTFAPFLFILARSPLTPSPQSGSYVWDETTANIRRLMPHQYDPSYNVTSNSTALDPACVRRPLPVSSAYVGPGARPDFHTFDDVLLVVFFSHDRYDINLDGYREVYSPYFPNILFIGPASREDRGFMYSYDVVLDSYMAHEDFNSGWFKMGGRMAHHMFYTAVKDNPCYAGYLWAPFDALLNVPRFMQFPQDNIWYHSPLTNQYIPNPAQPGTVTVVPRPPPARISELRPHQYYEEANAWGAGWVWWWGEKNMGMEVCMHAYERVPLDMRRRIEGMIGSPGHLIGGSADTIYLPGHLRAAFLDVLGTFLQTDCFLEIALPTTLHLILPLDEEIVWVDHWWKNPPPWNTTYVRQLWAQGYEVDSFHSFHWGDVQDDGFFGPNQESVRDMRELLADSFRRQGITPPT